MTTRIRIVTNDGMALQGGHELTLEFTCEDTFLERQIDTYGNEGLDYLVEETAKDIAAMFTLTSPTQSPTTASTKTFRMSTTVTVIGR